MDTDTSSSAPSSTSSPAAGCATPAPRRARAPRRSCSRWRASRGCARASHIDERCAGFFALGLAKATGPAGRRVACTSGTAAANLAPAVHRGARGARAAARAHRRPPARAARGRRRPDDRPAQALRRRGEVVLRGRHPRGDARPPALDPRARLPRLLDGARGRAGPGAPRTSRCASRSCPTTRCPTDPAAADAPASARGSTRPRTRGAARRARVDAAGRARSRRAARRRSSPGASERDRELGARAGGFAARAGWPLLADPLSGARQRPGGDRPLRRAAARPSASPPPTRPSSCSASATCRPPSRCAPGWPARRRAPARARPRRRLAGPDGVVGTVLAADAAADARRRRRAPSGRHEQARGSRMAAPTGARPTAPPPSASRRRSATGCPSRGWPRSSASALPADATLFVASSMPVRDVEKFFPAPRGAAARALQPRRQRDRRDGVGRVRRRRGRRAGRSSLLIGDVALPTTSAGCSPPRGWGCRWRSCCSTTTAAGSSTSCRSPGEHDGVRGARRHAARRSSFARAAALFGLDHRPVGRPDRPARGARRRLGRRRRDAHRGSHQSRGEPRASPAGIRRRGRGRRGVRTGGSPTAAAPPRDTGPAAESRWRPSPARLGQLFAGLWLFGTGEALLVHAGLGGSRRGPSLRRASPCRRRSPSARRPSSSPSSS